MQIVNKEKPIKLCHCRPGDTVKLPDSEDVFLVCVFGPKGGLADRHLGSMGLYNAEHPLFLVSLSTGEATPMPHLSSQVRVVKSFVTIGQNAPL